MGFDLDPSPRIEHWKLAICGSPKANWRRGQAYRFFFTWKQLVKGKKTEQGERIIYSAPGSRILAWEGYGFFSSPSQFFVVTDISPHFPGIKNPFWIIHSILNLAGTCIHNKLNLPRQCWDLSWMCQWQTTRILSFIFNMTATGRVTSSCEALRGTDGAFY